MRPNRPTRATCLTRPRRQTPPTYPTVAKSQEHIADIAFSTDFAVSVQNMSISPMLEALLLIFRLGA